MAINKQAWMWFDRPDSGKVQAETIVSHWLQAAGRRNGKPVDMQAEKVMSCFVLTHWDERSGFDNKKRLT